MNPNLIPLAHGALGPWDEIIPTAVVAILGIALAAAAIIGHKKGDESDDESADETARNAQGDSGGELRPAEQNAAPADHFRLD